MNLVEKLRGKRLRSKKGVSKGRTILVVGLPCSGKKGLIKTTLLRYLQKNPKTKIYLVGGDEADYREVPIKKTADLEKIDSFYLIENLQAISKKDYTKLMSMLSIVRHRNLEIIATTETIHRVKREILSMFRIIVLFHANIEPRKFKAVIPLSKSYKICELAERVQKFD